MRGVFVGFCVSLLWVATVCGADNAFVGRILSPEPSPGWLWVAVFQAGHHGRGHGSHHGPGDRAAHINVIYGGKELPGFVRKDAVVRFKGRFMGTDRFMADEILEFRNPDTDPTGVRQRLLDHCRRQP